MKTREIPMRPNVMEFIEDYPDPNIRMEKLRRAWQLYNTHVYDQYDDYDRDEDGNLLSCCGDILDTDIMICPTCNEHQ